MDIKYFGHASFFLKGKTGSVVTDPYEPEMVGLKFPKDATSSIVTVSHEHEDHNRRELVAGDPLIINIAGEYEKDKIKVTGWQVFHDKESGAKRGKNILYKIIMDEISILHCGDLGHTLSDELVDEIGPVDVLLIPVGGIFTIGAEDAAKVVHEVEPSIVIPMHYNSPKLNQKIFAELAGVDEFLQKMDTAASEPVKKLTLKKEDLGQEMKVVVMEYGQ